MLVLPDQDVPPDRDLFVKFGNRRLQLVALAHEFGPALGSGLQDAFKLDVAGCGHVVEIEKLADAFEAEAETLAAKDQLEAAAGAASGRRSSFVS